MAYENSFEMASSIKEDIEFIMQNSLPMIMFTDTSIELEIDAVFNSLQFKTI